jgi:AraC-like DNA-binding protein
MMWEKGLSAHHRHPNAADRRITKVEDVACRFNLSIRTLQRMFHRYVGVSPKWLIRRYRLREAAERLASGEAVD